MKKLTMDDLQPIAEYELGRDAYRKSVLSHKQPRRINLGPDIAVTFEDRTTMTFQIQEMMRAERLVHDSLIQVEIDVYNDLIPDQGELSATLFIEITESDQVKEKLHKFLGLTDGESLWLQIGDTKIYAAFEEGRAEEDKISSVHYIRFTLTKSVQENLKNSAIEAKIGIDQGTYKYTTVLSSDSRKSLINDLRPA